jgi:hypothetical protein
MSNHKIELSSEIYQALKKEADAQSKSASTLVSKDQQRNLF